MNAVPTPSEGYLVIEPDSAANREIIYYTSKGANYVTCPSVAAGRGVGGTSAAAHSSGVAVQMNVVAEHFEALQDGTAFAVGGIGASPYADGWTPILGSTPNTVTYNGNRNYDLVFNSTDLTGTLSPGMKLQLTRTVAAPTKCADLESSSSQYFSKSSPAGMTFTDDFTVSAWVKLESYAQGIIVGRCDTTNVNGWQMYVDSSGRLAIQGLSSPNSRTYITYASIPLNKWVHVAASLDMSGASGKTYFDGVEVPGAISGTATSLTLGASLGIGANAIGGATSNFFDGKIAQVAIFSAVLSASTIRSYMSQGLSGSETSLVSAYSLNNSLNDLSANANNLTANGGAAATATDSPFANAVTAGLLEYAEVNSVSFSTNTTVNVRVPDTCMIPTSGGVSAVSYSTQSNPYGLPYFSKVLGQVLLGSNQTTTGTSYGSVVGVSTTVYIPQGAKVRVSFSAMATNNTTGNTYVLAVFDGAVGGTQIVSGSVTPYSASVQGPLSAYAEISPTTGSHTFNAGHLVTPGGTGTLISQVGNRAELVVELV